MKRRDFLAAAVALPASAALDNRLLRSAAESLRFTVERTLTTHKGRSCSSSSFVDVDGNPMTWHDFGVLEGPGWAANAVGGAWEIYRFGQFTRNRRYQQIAVSILDHVLEAGFISPDGLIRPYRLIPENRFVFNYKHRDEWLCPGSMAKIGVQLLTFADSLPSGARKRKMQHAAANCAAWLHARVKPTASGWYPRRCTPAGEPYQLHADNPSQKDPLFDGSADSLFIL
ncbi:MAG: hypothetical protein NTY38_13095, partial [Acidobacteria bacterium]|nr:hypothetical protein [Acidobacteriota bacterium]